MREPEQRPDSRSSSGARARARRVTLSCQLSVTRRGARTSNPWSARALGVRLLLRGVPSAGSSQLFFFFSCKKIGCRCSAAPLLALPLLALPLRAPVDSNALCGPRPPPALAKGRGAAGLPPQQCQTDLAEQTNRACTAQLAGAEALLARGGASGRWAMGRAPAPVLFVLYGCRGAARVAAARGAQRKKS